MRLFDFSAIDAFSKKQQYHDNLRDYQKKNKELVYQGWNEGLMNIMLQMPTGTGKTHLFSSLIKDIQDYYYTILSSKTNLTREEKKQNAIPKVLVLVHRKELVDQIHDTLVEKYHHTCGIVAGGIVYGESKNVIVATTQTMGRKPRLEKWESTVNFDFIIIDEAHHSPADSYQRIRKAWPNARLLGVTATPYRLNHQPFTDIYEKLITSEPVYKFIENGYLCQYDYYSIKPTSLIQYQIDHLATDFSGDYDEHAMETLLNQDRIRASILGTYEKFAKGKKGIVYTINRMHNLMLASLFSAHGYSVAYIDSNTLKEERQQTVDDFRNGKLDIIFNVNIFSEGFDCPDVEFIQLARPTKSLSMYLQQVGRGFRTAEGKDKVLFLDNVGLFNRFGLPSARRAWQHYFEGREDWQDEKGCGNGNLGEPRDTGVDLSEGNEEVNLIYTSSTQQPDEEPQPLEMPNDNLSNNMATIDDNTIIRCGDRVFELSKLSRRELLEMLILIEKERKTGVIDVMGLEAQLSLDKNNRRKELEEFIAKSGFSQEEILAFLTSNQS